MLAGLKCRLAVDGMVGGDHKRNCENKDADAV